MHMEVRALFGRFVWRGVNIDDVTIHPSVGSRINPTLKVCEPEMITIRFAGWISGRIVSLQSDMDIQKLLSNRNRIRISETLLSIFRGFRLWKKLHNHSFCILNLRKQLFRLGIMMTPSLIYVVISVP